jgi:signal transduction histidine kinase
MITIQIDPEKPDVSGERYVNIRVSDNGIGIEEKNMDKIFLPYFSTKGRKGTGIGLSTVKQIVEHCSGTLSVSSQLGKGATFCIRLPLSL